MILEAIVSTISPAGAINFAPMGVHLLQQTPGKEGNDFPRSAPREQRGPAGDTRPGFRLRPYSSSQTYKNLYATREGVICFTDDVLLFVETALFSSCPPYSQSRQVRPPRLAGAGAFWEFRVTTFDAAIEPAVVEAEILHCEAETGVYGFCRARMAVLEAAIAATRWQYIETEWLARNWPYWRDLVNKTGGVREKQAYSLVCEFLQEKGISLP